MKDYEIEIVAIFTITIPAFSRADAEEQAEDIARGLWVPPAPINGQPIFLQVSEI